MSNSSIQFECLKCGQGVVAERDQCGEHFPCPKCNAELVVPPKSIDTSLFDDIFESLQESRQDGETSKQTSARERSPVTSEKQEPPREVSSQSGSIQKPPRIKEEVTSKEMLRPDQSRSRKAAPETDVKNTKSATTKSEKTQPVDEFKSVEAVEAVEAIESAEAVDRIEDDLIEITSEEGDTELPESAVESYLASVNIPESGEQQALKVEGLEFDDLNQVLTVKCRICDSLIHTNMAQAGQKVECPVCFSSVEISEANVRKATKKDFVNSRETRLSIDIKKKSVEASAKSDVKDDPIQEFALAPLAVEQPSKTVGSAERKSAEIAASGRTSAKPSENIGKELSQANSSTPNPPPDPPKKSRRELYEAAQRKHREADQGNRLGGIRLGGNRPGGIRLGGNRPKETRPKDNQPSGNPYKGASKGTDTETNNDLSSEPFSWTELIKGMLSQPITIGMLAFATLMIASGSLLMSIFEVGESETIIEWIKGTALWFAFGAMPYSIGTLFLWFIGGRLFREAASGNRKIDSWKIDGFTDFQSTLMLLGFSMLVAGLPISPIPIMYPFVSPIRFIIAPLLLVAVWYNQNPLAIIGVDAFNNFRRETKLWGAFYYPIVGLAFLAFIGGLLLWVPMSYGGFLTSPIGAAFVVIATASFAIVTGWHCGEVVNNLKPKAKKGLRKTEDEAAIAETV